MAAKWEYRVSSVLVVTGDESNDKANDHVTNWSAQGWELINGSNASYGVQTAPLNTVSFMKYFFYWRRPNPNLGNLH